MTDEDGFDGYAKLIDLTADVIEQYLREHPEDQHLTQGKYEVKSPGLSLTDLITIEPSLHDVMKKKDREAVARFTGQGMTGFQWDCALASARQRLNLGSTPMSSMMEINVG